MNKNKLFASVIGLLVFVAGLSAKDYQVAMFGIKSDGVTLNTPFYPASCRLYQ